MSKVTDIRDHPRFKPPLDPEDPNYERDQYLDLFDNGDLGPPPNYGMDAASLDDPGEIIGDMKALLDVSAAPAPKPEVSLSVCTECKFEEDSRPAWKRFFLPNPKSSDLLCRKFPRDYVQNPVTGQKGYAPQSPLGMRERTRVDVYATPNGDRYVPCVFLNPIGECRMFEPKISR